MRARALRCTPAHARQGRSGGAAAAAPGLNGPMRRADHERQIATALAGAFLAGEWEPAAMGRRGKRALADRRRWPTDLAEIVVRAYPDRPADRPRELAALIAACDPFRRAVQDRGRPVRVHTWMA